MYVYYFDWAPELVWCDDYQAICSSLDNCCNLTSFRCDECVWIVPGTVE